MKKVINGKMYSTDTAKELASYSNIADVRDFHWYEEKLFQKKTGEYFLYGEGGPMTRYARTIGTNEWSGGERIMPMSYSEAQKWAEEHLTGEEYEQIFGSIEDDGSKQMVTIYINSAKWEQAKRAAAYNNLSIGEYIENLIG